MLCKCIVFSGYSDNPPPPPASFPGAVVKAACFECRRLRVRAPQMFLLCSLVKIQYNGEHPGPRGSVLGLRPPGLEFRILWLEGCVISFISPPSGGSPGPAQPICAHFLSFHLPSFYHAKPKSSICLLFKYKQILYIGSPDQAALTILANEATVWSSMQTLLALLVISYINTHIY